MSETSPSSDGLIHAMLLDGHGGARQLSWESLRAWKREDGLLWMHLDYSRQTARDWLLGPAGLPEVVAEALLAEETRPRTALLDRGLLLILRGVNLNPGADPEDMVSIRLWAEDGRIITTRRRRLLSVGDLATELIAGNGAQDAGDLIEGLADGLIRRMSDVVDDAEDKVADIEERVMTDALPGLRGEVADLRRQVIALRRYLAPQRDALSRLMTEKVPWVGEINRLHLRETLERLTRYVEDLDAVRDRCLVAHEEIQNRSTDQLNRRMYLLSVVAALFLPLGFLTGLLGINVGGIPGSEDPHGFLLFLLVIAGVVAFQLWLFRKMKWF
ncbi:MAG: zinc transporter ZntB [Verrucomicrobiales bacterium]|nr:zinc transporter ZntB [Verrucomicrobiales bacterium]